MSLVLTLPYPPANNVYYRHGQGRTYLSKQGRDYKEKVADLISDLGIQTFHGRLTLHMGVAAPSIRHRDIDSHAKAVLDALQDAGVYDDDEQIDQLTIIRLPKARGGYCDVVIFEAP